MKPGDARALALLDVNDIVSVMQMFVQIWPRAFIAVRKSFTLAMRTLATVCLNSDVSVKFSECLILLNSIITIFCKRKYYLFILVFLTCQCNKYWNQNMVNLSVVPVSVLSIGCLLRSNHFPPLSFRCWGVVSSLTIQVLSFVLWGVTSYLTCNPSP